MNWNWSVIWENLPTLLEGALLTIELVLLSGVFGIILALPLAILRTSKKRYISALPFAYIFFFRGTPLLVQIFLIYYGSSQFDVIKASFLWTFLKDPYWCAILAFTLNTSAYIAEIFRGAIQSIPKGEIEAAVAMGMNRRLMLKRIILPRALGFSLPAYSNEIILMLKSTALASTITLLDLTGMARNIIARTYTPLEIFFASGLIYLAMTVLFVIAFRQLEKHINRHQIRT